MGIKMYTRFCRWLIKMKVRMAGHCEGSGGGYGHCYEGSGGSGHCS